MPCMLTVCQVPLELFENEEKPSSLSFSSFLKQCIFKKT